MASVIKLDIALGIMMYCIGREHIDKSGSWQRSCESTTFRVDNIGISDDPLDGNHTFHAI